jgi:hypothetical protein
MLNVKRSPHERFTLSITAYGGADRDRTGDPLLAKQVLSQLSYSPRLDMVGLGGFEPPTSPLSGVRSNHLSYRPELGFGIKQCVWALKRAKGHY